MWGDFYPSFEPSYPHLARYAARGQCGKAINVSLTSETFLSRHFSARRVRRPGLTSKFRLDGDASISDGLAIFFLPSRDLIVRFGYIYIYLFFWLIRYCIFRFRLVVLRCEFGFYIFLYFSIPTPSWICRKIRKATTLLRNITQNVKKTTKLPSSADKRKNKTKSKSKRRDKDSRSPT